MARSFRAPLVVCVGCVARRGTPASKSVIVFWRFHVALVLEELVRRYQELAKRSSEMRVHL
jgi:hypothetical protein